MAFATTRLGAIHLPVNAQWVGDEVRFVLSDAEPKVLVVDRATAPHAAAAVAGSSVERVFVVPRSRGEIPDGTGDSSWAPFAELARADPFDHDLAGRGTLAAAIYTSGTTGRSKAALSTHSEFLYNCLAWSGVAGLGPGDVGFGAYDGRGIALAVSFLGPLLSGVKLLVGRLVKRAWADTARVVVDEGVTMLTSAPAMLALLMREAQAAGIDALPSVRALAIGSAPLPAAMLDPLERFLPNCAVYNCYGATESQISCCGPELLREKPGAAGTAMPGTEIRVAGDDGTALAVGEVGRVLVRGPGVMEGYLNRPDETSAALRDGWLVTGDLGSLDDDGCLWLVGRIRDLINTGGWNVYAPEVEAVIAAVPGVQFVGVVGRPDPTFGETIVAYVQPFESATLTAADVDHACETYLAKYKRPRRVEIRERLPVNALMKVQKHLIDD